MLSLKERKDMSIFLKVFLHNNYSSSLSMTVHSSHCGAMSQCSLSSCVLPGIREVLDRREGGYQLLP